MGRRKKNTPKLGEEISDVAVRNNVITMLQKGMESSFWEYLVKIMDLNVRECERQLIEEDLETIEDVKELQNKVYYQKQLKKLPQTMIDRLTSEGKTSEIDVPLDPYE